MKTILITGCSSGIGLCAAKTLHQQGYQVIATVRQTQDAAPLEKLGIKTMLMDLNSSQSIQIAVEQTLTYAGKIDFLFNNAAYGQPGAVEDLNREALNAQFQTNVIGTQELTNLVIRQMRVQGHGRVIYNSSVLGLVAMPYRGAYNASKYAIEGLADTLRLELHGSNIQVSLIEPGPILSRFRHNAFNHFQKHIDKSSSAHRDVYLEMEARLTKVGAAAPFTLGPEAVVAKLLNAIESKRPKCRYYVTFPTYLFAYLKRCLPQRMLDKLLRRIH